MTDDLTAKLRNLKSQLPAARTQLSEAEKDELIKAIGGPRTAESIRKAMSKLPHERIPWLFSSLDSQLVLDIMANDMDAAIARAKTRQNREHS
jgi:hypothetical protein